MFLSLACSLSHLSVCLSLTPKHAQTLTLTRARAHTLTKKKLKKHKKEPEYAYVFIKNKVNFILGQFKKYSCIGYFGRQSFHLLVLPAHCYE